MKNKGKNFSAGILIFVLVIISAGVMNGCGSGKEKEIFPGSAQNTEVYSSIGPQGDFVVVSISGSNITIQNQTNPSQSIGPVHFSQKAFSGFHNVYQTDALDPSGQYVIFALMSGVIVDYQKVGTDGTVGNAGYALFQKPFAISDLRPANTSSAKRFNFIEFIPPNSTLPNGFATFGHTWVIDKGNGTGAISGAKYDVQLASVNQYKVDAKGIPYGVYSPYGANGIPAVFNWTDISNSIDPATGTMKQYHSQGNYWEMTAMTPGGVMIADRDSDHGGSFSVIQAASPDFKATYAGTYITFSFDLSTSSQSSNAQFFRLALNTASGGLGSGTIGKIGTGCVDTMTITPFSKISTTSAPGGVDVLNAFKSVSGISPGSAASKLATANTYLGYGSFVITSSTGNLIFIEFDPSGNYFFFMSFDTSSPTLHSAYGFGIKDPMYDMPAVPSTISCSIPPVLSAPLDDVSDVYLGTYFNEPHCQPATTDNPDGLHKGIDLLGPIGTTVKAAAPGVVTSINTPAPLTFDDGTIIQHIVVSEGVSGGYTVTYNFEPVDKIFVTVGQVLNTGDPVGLLGHYIKAPTANVGLLDFRMTQPNNSMGPGTFTCLTPFVSPQFKGLLEAWFSRFWTTTVDHPGPCTCHYHYPPQ